ncbi:MULTISPECIES: ribosome hibernation promoting factor [unclassified Vibrio]|uniref:Ribosome hibernation promoting factor n=1 Tax=Vibrio sp. HB236076 TaxID=3232307 RepID=A0AB39HGJ3_9VIBR|nr:ribosome hibernation promoting factor [Vibrio sp. HB161653]MDP5255507.1 ribosome hibernation promoting factor [Vibrio sp. HB161653]
MQINIQGHHVDLTDSMQDYVNSKFEKLERFFEQINNVQVVLKVEKIHQIAEATLHVNQGEIHASADSDNMYAAIDSLVDKLVRQLNKHKEKLNSH